MMNYTTDLSTLTDKDLDSLLNEVSFQADKMCYDIGIDYNMHDVTLIDMLEEKLKFIEQVIAFAYDAKVNYSDTFTTVKPWDIIIHNYLLDRNIVVPQNIKHHYDGSLVGGYVKEPKLGLSRWVVSFDLNSLYPHLIMPALMENMYNDRVEYKKKMIEAKKKIEKINIEMIKRGIS